MTAAQTLANALNALAKGPGFDYRQARATARKNGSVDWPATKAANFEFNPEVDGCESFVLNDGSICDWSSAHSKYVAR